MNNNSDNNDNNDTNTQFIRLCNKRSVDRNLLDLVRFVVLEKIPDLSPDKDYTLRQIFGEEKWDMLSPINRIDAGYCMVHLVEKGELPFKFAKEKGDNNKRYRLK